MIVQDVRGRCESTGTFDLLHEYDDARDTIEWIMSQVRESMYCVCVCVWKTSDNIYCSLVFQWIACCVILPALVLT